MAIKAHVYGNGGAGGPVDYTTPVATVSGTSWTFPPPAPSTDWTWAVRLFDDATGLEEKNVSATVRRVTDAVGHDVTDRPNPPSGVVALPTAGGHTRVKWSYRRAGQSAPPVGFRVYLGTPTADLTAPAATVPYLFGLDRYTTGPSLDPSGLSDGVAYQVVVSAYDASGLEAFSEPAGVTGNTAAPDPPDPVSADLIP